MTRLLPFVLSFLIVAGTATARAPEMADVWNGAEIGWRDIRSGIYKSSKTGKPVIMVFHAPWCSACKKFRSVFFDKGIVEASKDFVMILIDADADKQANGAFSPDGTYVPRTIFWIRKAMCSRNSRRWATRNIPIPLTSIRLMNCSR